MHPGDSSTEPYEAADIIIPNQDSTASSRYVSARDSVLAIWMTRESGAQEPLLPQDFEPGWNFGEVAGALTRER